MTDTDLITFLAKPIVSWTDSEIATFTANRPRCLALAATPACINAAATVQLRLKTIPGAAAHPGLDDHVTHASGKRKTVCTSAVIGYFNIAPDRYKYSGHSHEMGAVLNRFGWSYASRKSAHGVSPRSRKYPTLAAVAASIAAAGESGHYAVYIKQEETCHVILLDATGKTVVDTASAWTTGRCRVYEVRRIVRLG